MFLFWTGIRLDLWSIIFLVLSPLLGALGVVLLYKTATQHYRFYLKNRVFEYSSGSAKRSVPFRDIHRVFVSKSGPFQRTESRGASVVTIPYFNYALTIEFVKPSKEGSGHRTGPDSDEPRSKEPELDEETLLRLKEMMEQQGSHTVVVGFGHAPENPEYLMEVAREICDTLRPYLRDRA
jgi:hypothetical protein